MPQSKNASEGGDGSDSIYERLSNHKIDCVYFGAHGSIRKQKVIVHH